MNTAKVIGSVVATKKDDRLIGAKLVVIQPVNSSLEEVGKPLVAVDMHRAGIGDYVFFAKSVEGAQEAPDPLAPVDAGVVGVIDHVFKPEQK